MTIDIELLFILLAVFQVKHFVADFPLQNDFMLEKKRTGWGFVIPLLSHVLVHGAFTLAIVLYLNSQLWWLVLVDISTHFIMDRIKSGPKYLGRYDNVRSKGYWVCFGFDQMVHHFNHYFIIWILLSSK